MYKELLWIFTQLPDDYIVLDTETTGLPDENGPPDIVTPVSYTHLRAHETVLDLVCRLLLEKKKSTHMSSEPQ